MQYPHLIIIAGCNGAGKSTFSSSLVKNVTPFDYDKKFIEIYNQLRDSEFRDKIATNQVTEELNHLISSSFLEKKTICFETNLHVFPFTWINEAKSLGYKISMYFFSLKNIELAKKRVEIRTKNKGHYVNDSTIEFKWKEGYKNLNIHFSLFDHIIYLDNTKPYSPKVMFELEKDEKLDFKIYLYQPIIPKYIKHRLPSIFELLAKNDK